MDRAVPFIQKAVSEDKPFFVVIWFHTPHQPVKAGPEFKAMYPGRSGGEQEFYGAITAMDLQMGRLRKELKAIGAAGNTMLWFGSDHGPEGDTDDQGTNRGSAGPFRGRKRTLWEGGIRVPELLEWPGHATPGSVTSVACSGLDYYPTILETLGFTMKDQPHPIDGISLLPLLEGRMKERPAPIHFASLGGTGKSASRGSPRFALVDNRYKLLTDYPEQAGVAATDQMFDLLDDPREITNIASQNVERVNSMKQQLVAFRKSYEQSLLGKDYAEPFTPTKYDIPPYEPGYIQSDSGENRANPSVKD
jgi:arylsulfatase A-like enzyme